MYIEQLGKVDIDAMYKVTTQERLLQNLVNEYEKFADPRLVSPLFYFFFWEGEANSISLRVREKQAN